MPEMRPFLSPNAACRSLYSTTESRWTWAFMHGVARNEGGLCNGRLALTVSEGAVRKYIEVTKHVMDTYGVDTYTRQNMEWLAGKR